MLRFIPNFLPTLFFGIVLFLSSAYLPALAGGLDISLSDESAEIVYLIDSDAKIGVGGADLAIGAFFNENDDIVLNAGILVSGHSTGKNRALQFGGGAKAYLGELDLPEEDSLGAIAIGGKIGYIFPANTPMAISLEAYIAPDITSFNDISQLLEWVARFEIEVAPTTRLYVGYRNLEVELENSDTDYELDDTAILGVRFSF